VQDREQHHRNSGTWLTDKEGDTMNWSKDKESVAHHEAGHWVMSHALGCPLDNVGIALDASDQSWAGSSSSQRKRMDLDPDKGIKVAFAGPWAEILFQARRLFPACNLDTEDEPLALVEHVLCEDDDDYDCSNRLDVSLSLPNGAPESLTIDANAFSNDGANARYFAKGDNARIKKGLAETREPVNRLWPAIETLAKNLLDRLGRGHEVMLTSTEAESWGRPPRWVSRWL
jgi:hypothetical protein